MDLSNFVTVLPIVLICYLAGMGFKQMDCVKDEMIPVLVGIVGAIIAIPAMYVMPDFPATDVITAIGIASGLASTGAHQVYKQNKSK